MTTVTAADGLQALALSDIKLSGTVSQAQRRAHFDKVALAELADSIKTHGVLVPVIARAVNGHFELVAGERRYLAAKKAGLTAITVNVRTLTDEQVLQIQLIENLQREGLHPLAEAEGYEELQGYGHSAEEIADKIGKSKGYVYSRLKLCGLAKLSRTAFYEGKLTASTALLLARIPIEALQLEALKAITSRSYGADEVMPFRDAARHIRETYMTNLSDAGFPTEDATLVAAAGACGACPKRTGNQAELFDDVKSGNVCTDPVCFKDKRQAHAVRAIAQAKESGQEVIVGSAAKKIIPWQHSLANGYSKLTDVCYDDKKHRTYAQLLGKDFKPTLVQNPETGALVKIVTPADAKRARSENGIKSLYDRPAPRASTPKPAKRDLLREAVISALLTKICEKAPKVLPLDLLKQLVETEMDEIAELPETIEDAFFGWPKHEAPDLFRLLWVLRTFNPTYGPAGDSEDLLYVTKVAKGLGIDAKKVRAEVAKTAAAEKKAAPFKPPVAKKKAAKKK